jgi:RepB DNA-primase from phage plasmid
MNTLRDGAYSRTKRDVHEIRHLYLDLDYRGPQALKTIQNSDEVPQPNFVLDTSPGKHQVVWKVEGFARQQAEDFQQSMAHDFRADSAATDVARVLRLPGFANKKYGDEYTVRVTKHSDTIYTARDFKIESGPTKAARHMEQAPSRLRGPRNAITQSERDWAYAKRALARGDDPEEVIRRIADFCADEKHDPEYYARLTVSKAQAYLQNRSVHTSASQEPGPDPQRRPVR